MIERVGGRTSVFGNIVSIRFGIQAAPEEMSAEVEREATFGEKARGFIVSTGSPFPLETDPDLIDILVATAHEHVLE